MLLSVRYKHDVNIHNTNASSQIIPFILNYYSIKSVLDVGCGLGTWLKVFEENGINDIQGLDGTYIDKSMLIIEQDKVHLTDLEKFYDTNRKFDLAISLEVAEHLSIEASDNFVKTLTNASDLILFSAAIPNQGGMNHINEQWPVYWEEKFREQGYEIHDVIRDKFWENDQVDFWYKQNMFLIAKKGMEIKIPKGEIPRNLVHPNMLEFKANLLNGNIGVSQGLKIFFKSLIYSFKKIM